MNLDRANLTDAPTEEVLDVLISHITKTDEEIEQERAVGRPSTTELKVFVAENQGYELGTLNEEVEVLSQSKEASHHAKSFVDTHNFSETQLNEEVALVEITTPDYERTDQFIFIDEGQYLKAITVERREWTEKTVEKLIKHLPTLERLFISSEELEEIVESLGGTELVGFTAKYRSIGSERGYTIEFHGGTFDDLKQVKDDFNAKPTRLEFTQSNSPAAVLRSSVKRHGYYKHTTVLRGHESQGRDTLEEIFDQYGARDQMHFAVEFPPMQKPVADGYAIAGFTTIHLQGEEDQDREELADRLVSDVLDKKQRYTFSAWETGNYFVFDKEHKEPFEVGVEGSDIVLYAKEGTSATTFREFCRIVLTEFQSTYSVEKTSRKLLA